MATVKEAPDMSEKEVARKAYYKWEARAQANEPQLHDWLEAEAELRSARDLARQLKEVEVQLANRSSEGNLAKGRLAAEHAIGEILGVSADFTGAASPILRVLCECLDWDVGAF